MKRLRNQDGVSDIVALILTFLVIVVVALGITWVVQGNNFFMLKVFGVKTANVQRQIFEQTKTFQQGQIQQAGQSWTEWLATDNKAEKAAIADLMNHNDADWPQSIWDACTPNLRAWLESIQPGGPNSTTPSDNGF
ncbi:MAG: hypothetical protein NTV39_02950 [Candidatus Saccharibacteria bacterium]|nr:hypothetical protein [Candidatus Saccharibacteria bacterium]